jgi:uncharacterized protein (DUF169 family)
MYDVAMPASGDDGRTGRVPAGCVFWIEATKGSFSTIAEDHANCSVGSMTHGFKTLEEVAPNLDVAALLESGWVTLDALPMIPVVRKRPRFVSYGPLAETSIDPDVVFIRVNAKQAMTLSDAIPGIRFEGKPQCHIVAMAKEDNLVAVSVGCMLSRVRTGISNAEMTCAIPASRLAKVVAQLKTTVAADNAVAVYASKDAARFGR